MSYSVAGGIYDWDHHLQTEGQFNFATGETKVLVRSIGSSPTTIQIGAESSTRLYHMQNAIPFSLSNPVKKSIVLYYSTRNLLYIPLNTTDNMATVNLLEYLRSRTQVDIDTYDAEG